MREIMRWIILRSLFDIGSVCWLRPSSKTRVANFERRFARLLHGVQRNHWHWSWYRRFSNSDCKGNFALTAEELSRLSVVADNTAWFISVNLKIDDAAIVVAWNRPFNIHIIYNGLNVASYFCCHLFDVITLVLLSSLNLPKTGLLFPAFQFLFLEQIPLPR